MYAALSLLVLVACLPSAWLFGRKALDDYMAQVDPHYNYTLVKTEKRPLLGVTIYSLNMTSQKWLDESEVNRPIWWHQLFIVLPKEQTVKNSCLLFIIGENNDVRSVATSFFLAVVRNLAVSTGSCVALLNQIPNQPITFHKAPLKECKNSKGNDAMGCSWWTFLNDKTAPPHSLIQFPMVKATVRAMDTITAFLLKESETKMIITKFALFGGSKRGWVTWLTAAVDGRVVSFFPLCADLLNIVKALHHQYRSYCGWSFIMKNLHNANMTRQLDEPRFKEMVSHIDPLEYNARYSNKSKFIIKTAGDEVFLPDNTNFYWDELRGEKYIRIIPNVGHLLIMPPGMLLNPLKAFYVATMQNLRKPQISWNRTETNTTGIINFFTDQKPSSIVCYTATSISCKRRDFRLFVAPGIPNPVLWFPGSVKKMGTGVYKAEVAKPSRGWRGFFIKATFPGPGNHKYAFSSEMHIIPNTYPCADCNGDRCYGVLV